MGRVQCGGAGAAAVVHVQKRVRATRPIEQGGGVHWRGRRDARRVG